MKFIVYNTFQCYSCEETYAYSTMKEMFEHCEVLAGNQDKRKATINWSFVAGKLYGYLDGHRDEVTGLEIPLFIVDQVENIEG